MKHLSNAEGKALVTAYNKSGITQRKFIEKAGITQGTLQYWRRRTKELEGDEDGFIKIAIPQEGDAVSVRISLGQFELSFPTLPPATWLCEFVSYLKSSK